MEFLLDLFLENYFWDSKKKCLVKINNLIFAATTYLWIQLLARVSMLKGQCWLVGIQFFVSLNDSTEIFITK